MRHHGAKLAEMEQRLRAYVRQCVANVVYVSPSTLSTSEGLGDGVDGRPADQQSQRYVHRMQHAGFRSRPVVGAQYVALECEGGSNKLVSVAEDDGQSSAVPLEEGEAKAYSPAKPACVIWFDKNGALHVDADSGQDVIVNGGTLRVAREKDDLDVGTLTAVAGPYPVTFTYVPTTPTGPGAPAVGSSAALAGIIKSGTGAANFKG